MVSPQCPGCLVTGSEDESIKIWDVLNSEKPKMVESRNFNLGVLHTVSMCPDLPFVVCLGGNNKEHNFKVWDMRNSMSGKTIFLSKRKTDLNLFFYSFSS